MEENKKSKIWLYAVILFTSAFIVLLFTAYSQIKLNNSLNNYKSQVNLTESEKNKFQQNFTSAQEMNSKLNGEIEKLSNENKSLNDDLEKIKSELKNTQEVQADKDQMAGIFSDALSAYLNGNVVESAAIIRNVSTNYLDGKLLDAYKVFSSKVYSEAGNVLFNEGYRLYGRGKYNEAIEKLLLSSQYDPFDTFSDKCLYYLAYSEFKAGNKETALVHMDKLISGYPSSKYLRSAKRFVERYGK